MKSHIAIYLRVSLEDYDLKESINKDESNSIYAQRKLIESYIANDDTLKELPSTEFVDDGCTGTNTNRPAFQDMIEQVKTGKISCVMVKDISRFGRNYLDVGEYLEYLFPFLGIRFVSVNDNYDSEDYKGTNIGLDMAFKNILHDYYSRDLSVKVRSAQRSRMVTGKYVTVPPYGYMRDPKDKHHLILNPDTAPIARKMFEMLIEGYSSTQIAAYLNSENIPTPLEASGRKRIEGMLCDKPLMWSHAAVLNIVGNYKYTGAMVNHTRESVKLRDGATKRVEQKDWIINEGMHEAIVTHEEFHQARRSLRQVKKHSRKDREESKCVYYCAHCGRKLRKTYGTNVYLSCVTHKYVQNAECKNIRWTMQEMESIVLNAFREQLLILDTIRKAVQTSDTDKSKKYLSQMAQIKRQIDDCQIKKSDLYMDYRMGKLSKEQFIEVKQFQTDEENRLKEELDRAHEEYEAYLEEKQELKDRKDELEKYSISGSVNRDKLLDLMYQGIDRVIVHNDDSVDIYWKFYDTIQFFLRQRAA